MNNRVLKTVPIEVLALSSFISWIIDQHSLRNKLKRTNDIVCYSISKKIRASHTFKDLKDYLSGVSLLSKPNMIQLAKPQLFREPKVLIYKLLYCGGKYNSKLFTRKDKSTLEIYNPDFYEKAKDIGRLLMLYLEETKCKKVLSVEMKLISDDDFNLWFAGVMDCKVIEKSDINLYQIQNTKDLLSIPVKKKTIQLSKIKSYLKNERANLAIIVSPDLDESSEEKDADYPNFKQEKLDALEGFPYLRKNSISKKENKKKKKEQDPDEKFRDFLEILSKTFAKFEADAFHRQIIDEDVNKEMERISKILNPEIKQSRNVSTASINKVPGSYSPSRIKTKSSANSIYNHKSNVVSRQNSAKNFNFSIRKVVNNK